MTAGLLLLAAALCLAPWQGPATRRLRELEDAAGRDFVVGEGRARRRGVAAAPGSTLHAASHAVLEWVRHRLPQHWARRLPGATAVAGSGALAWMLDLLSVALLAGLPTHLALAAVGDALEPSDPHVAAPLRAVASRVRLGATPAQAWHDVPGAEQVAPVAPALARATDGGGSVRAALSHAAQRMRSDADAAALARAEKAAVLVAGPLGLCFLPAFVCLGIVPVVIGLADGMLPGMLP